MTPSTLLRPAHATGAVRRRRTPRPRPFDVRDLLAHGRYESVSAFARDAGVDRRTVHRWIATGLDPDTADRLAVHVLGCHPFEVFGRAWFDLDEEPTLLAA